MSSDYISTIKNVAVITNLEDDSLCVLDISEIRKQAYSKQYGGVMFGAIGGALEALIIEGVASYRIRSLVGGSIEPVRESISDFDAKSIFEAIVHKKLSEQLKESRGIQSVIMLKKEGVVETGDGISISNAQKGNYPDTLLTIEYRYGLGAFVENEPLPAIMASVSVISIPENRKLMTDTIMTYGCSGNAYNLVDYARDKGEIYRRCFEEVVEEFGERLAGRYF
jgi:hypothetical protein